MRERRMREKRIGRAIVVVGHLTRGLFVLLNHRLLGFECSTDWVEEKQESIVHEQDQIAKRRCTTYNTTFMAETFWCHYDRDLNRLFLKQERLGLWRLGSWRCLLHSRSSSLGCEEKSLENSLNRGIFSICFWVWHKNIFLWNLYFFFH